MAEKPPELPKDLVQTALDSGAIIAIDPDKNTLVYGPGGLLFPPDQKHVWEFVGASNSAILWKVKTDENNVPLVRERSTDCEDHEELRELSEDEAG